ncbi:MAG TPA: amidase family protein, partial [Acidobacteriaceae bacterium]|nr:amidase family protein [Acidobacteriaceae bacterium]
MDTALPSISEIRAALGARKAAATEAAQACFARIEANDPTIHAYLALDREGALKKAGEIDSAAAKGEALGALAGVPIGIKDVLTQQGLP